MKHAFVGGKHMRRLGSLISSDEKLKPLRMEAP